jgi:hypothetical protein
VYVKKSIVFLALLMLIFSTFLSAVTSFVIFRELTMDEASCKTYQLVLAEKSDYPLGKIKQTDKKGWLVQLYKDGGDGIINPLDNKGNPTGDDIMITDPFNFNASQKLAFPMKQAWHMNAYRFAPGDSLGQVSIGDRIFVRIFNNASIAKANKYLVSHKLYTISEGNEVVNYIPDYGWDKKGWITFKLK